MALTVKSYEDIMSEFKYALGSDIDTREGTLAHIAMSATAMGLAQLYEELSGIEKGAYASTAEGEQLDLCVDIVGLTRNKAKCAVVRMEGDSGFDINDKFIAGETEYTITGIEDGYYIATCNKAGKIGNEYIGEVMPKNSTNLGNMKIVSVIAKGSDKESDDDLRRRYIERIRCPICTGNVSYYREVINNIPGVGGIKVVPAFNGAGRVKVIITDNEHNEASDDLVQYVKEYLDPSEAEGQGLGVLPIGHRADVESVEKVDITIKVDVIGKANIAAYLRQANNYMVPKIKALNKNWSLEEKIIIRDRIIEDYFFTISSVTDVNVVSINNSPNRFALAENQIIGEVVFVGA